MSPRENTCAERADSVFASSAPIAFAMSAEAPRAIPSLVAMMMKNTGNERAIAASAVVETWPA